MFVLRNWDHSYDDKIINVIERDGKTHFYHLWDKVFVRKISKDTLNDHLKAMERQEIIKKDSFEVGKKRYITLTLKTIQERKRGIFEGVKRVKLHKNTLVKEKRILTMFVLSNAMLGFQLKKSSNTQIGSIPSVKGGKYSLRSVEGTTSADLLRLKDSTLYYNKKFAYLKISKFQIQRIIEDLRSDFPNILKPIQVNGKIRFHFVDESLERFVMFCDNMLYSIIHRTEYFWITGKKRKSKEVEWYKMIFGKKLTDEFFMNLKEKRFEKYGHYRHQFKKFPLRPHTMNKAIKKYTETLKIEMDKEVRSYYAYMIKFEDVKKKYPEFYDLMFGISFPKFIREEIIV
jgi:DNA-binding HxlR family transcriptional regulator